MQHKIIGFWRCAVVRRELEQKTTQCPIPFGTHALAILPKPQSIVLGVFGVLEFDGCDVAGQRFGRGEQMGCQRGSLAQQRLQFFAVSEFMLDERKGFPGVLECPLFLHEGVLGGAVKELVLLPPDDAVLFHAGEVVIEPSAEGSLHLHIISYCNNPQPAIHRDGVYISIIIGRRVMKLDDGKLLLEEVKKNLKTRGFLFSSQYVEELFSAVGERVRADAHFEGVIEHYLDFYLAYEACDSLPEINIFPLFYKILALPTQLVEDNSPDWQVYYKLVRTNSQEAKECKLHFLAKLIEYKCRDEILECRHKLWALLSKSVQKQFGSVSLPILTIFYYNSVHRSLFLDQEFSLHSLYEVLNTLYSKNKSLLALIFSKLLGENYQKRHHLDSILIGSINLLANLPAKNPALIDGFVVNKSLKSKVMREGFWSEKKEVSLKELVALPGYERCSVIKGILVLYGMLLLRCMEDLGSFTRIIAKSQEYLASSPGTFESLMSHVSVLLISSQGGYNIEPEEGADELIEKYCEDVEVLVLICIAFRKSRGWVDQLGKSLRKEKLMMTLELLIEYGLEEELGQSENQEVVDALVSVYNADKNSLGLEKVVINKLYGISCLSPPETVSQKIQSLLGEVRKLNPLGIYHTLLMKIQRIHSNLLLLYLNNKLDLETLMSAVQRFFDEDRALHLLINTLMKIMLGLTKNTERQQKQIPSPTPSLSNILFSVLNMSVHQQSKLEVQEQHPFIQKGVELVEAMSSYGEVMRKVFKFHFDRPSEIYIENVILRNRFLIRYIFVAKVGRVMKTLYGVVAEMEHKEGVLRAMFPSIQSDEARKVYLRYLNSKDVAEFRLQVEKYPEWRQHMVQQ